MHVGIDCRLPAYQMGGISQYILHLLPALAQVEESAGDPNQYTIFHSRKDGRCYLPSKAANFQRRTLWTPCHHRLERWSLAAELWPYRLDILHSPDFIPPAGGAKRRVITIHDLNFLYYPQFLTGESRRYYVGQIGWAVETADQIAADSHHTRQDLIERLQVPPEKVTAVHLAANPVYEQPHSVEVVEQTLAQYNLPAGYILFVGTLEPRKNLPTLLRAYHQLYYESHLDLPLVLVGSKGWLYEQIFVTIDKLDLVQQVRHLSGVPDVQVAHLYRAASLLAFPSYYEGFGLPPLESMHCGCPVVVSNRASLPEVVGEAGFLLDPDDVDGWAAAMARLLEDSRLRKELIQQGRWQAQKFTWQKTAEATLALYQKAVQ